MTVDGTAVVDRRRIELIEAGLPAAPVHHMGGTHALHGSGPPPSDDELAELVARVRASAAMVIARELDELIAALPAPVDALSLRAWPTSFPTDIATQRRPPLESRADPIMYRQELARAAAHRGWRVHHFEARAIEAAATARLGAGDPLNAPRALLGPPWTKDHRLAYAAAIIADG